MKLSNHLGYIKAVVGSLGIETGRLADMANQPVVVLDDWYAWPWCEPIDVCADLAWDEEFGWIASYHPDLEVALAAHLPM